MNILKSQIVSKKKKKREIKRRRVCTCYRQKSLAFFTHVDENS